MSVHVVILGVVRIISNFHDLVRYLPQLLHFYNSLAIFVFVCLKVVEHWCGFCGVFQLLFCDRIYVCEILTKNDYHPLQCLLFVG